MRAASFVAAALAIRRRTWGKFASFARAARTKRAFIPADVRFVTHSQRARLLFSHVALISSAMPLLARAACSK